MIPKAPGVWENYLMSLLGTADSEMGRFVTSWRTQEGDERRGGGGGFSN